MDKDSIMQHRDEDLMLYQELGGNSNSWDSMEKLYCLALELSELADNPKLSYRARYVLRKAIDELIR